MGTANSLRTIPVYRPTRRHTPEDCNLGIQCQLVNIFLSHMNFFFIFYSENVNSGVLSCDALHTSLVGIIGFWRNLQPLWRSQWEEGRLISLPAISWQGHDNVLS
jgi:hypothetical protein